MSQRHYGLWSSLKSYWKTKKPIQPTGATISPPTSVLSNEDLIATPPSRLPAKLDSAQGRRSVRCSMRSGRSIPLLNLLPSRPTIPHPDAVAKYAGSVAAKQSFPSSALNREMRHYEAESKARIEQYRKELGVIPLTLEPELQKKGGKQRLKERERLIDKYVSLYQSRKEKQNNRQATKAAAQAPLPRQPKRFRQDRPPITPESFAVWPPLSTPPRRERARPLAQSDLQAEHAMHPLANRHAQLKSAYVTLLAKLNAQPVTRENLDERIRTAVEHPTSCMKLPEEMLYEKYQLRKAFTTILKEKGVAEVGPNWKKLKQDKVRQSFEFKELLPSQQTPQ